MSRPSKKNLGRVVSPPVRHGSAPVAPAPTHMASLTPDVTVIEVPAAYHTMRKADLMAEAKDRGLSTSGNKQDIIDRLEG